MFLTIVSCSTLRIGPYLFCIEKFITQFKTAGKNSSSYSFSREWWFTSMARSSHKEKNACALIMGEIMGSMGSKDVGERP